MSLGLFDEEMAALESQKRADIAMGFDDGLVLFISKHFHMPAQVHGLHGGHRDDVGYFLQWPAAVNALLGRRVSEVCH